MYCMFKIEMKSQSHAHWYVSASITMCKYECELNKFMTCCIAFNFKQKLVEQSAILTRTEAAQCLFIHFVEYLFNFWHSLFHVCAE